MPVRANNRKPATDRLPLGPGAAQLSSVLDSLIAIRLEIANATSGEKALSDTVGRTNLLEVRTTLDRAIRDVKRVIEKSDRRHHTASRSDGQRGIGSSSE